MSKYEEYIRSMCRNGQYTPEEVRESALGRAVKKYYEAESKTDPILRHEFNCLSEE